MVEKVPGKIRQWSETLPLLLAGALLALRALYLFTHAVDSDEPQNLHVVYGWWKGDLPYLGQFDNHTPLLHWLFLPFAALVGENANVVVLARLALVPLSFGSVGLFYLLCRRLYDRRTALWSVAITLALADWSLKSIEFRPDILWMFLWFAALLVLVKPDGRCGPVSFFLAGLLLGASAAASVKTVFLVPALAAGWGGAWLLSAEFRVRYSWSKILCCALLAGVGLAVVPAMVAGYFAWRGALDEMRFCVFAINKDPLFTARSWLFLVGLPVGFAATAWLIRPGGLRPAYRGAAFLTAAAYTLAIVGFGPYESLAKQTFLPAYPLLIAAACHFWLSLRPWRDAQICVGGSTVCAALAVAMLWESPPFRNGTGEQRELLKSVLDHTKPGDLVMDLKGETIFRKRPVYLAYVGITTRAMESGRLAAPPTGQLRGTAFATERTTGFPQEMRAFLRKNYLSTVGGDLRVAGKRLKPSWEAGRWIERTRVEIPGQYVIAAKGHVLSERLISEPGEQVFDLPTGGKSQVLFWKTAWRSGLRPTED